MLGCSSYFANQTLDFSRFHEEKCIQNDQQKLVGGLEHFFYFSIQLGMSSSQHIPTDELHHFSEGLNHRSPGSWISPRLLKVASFAFERHRSHHNVVILIRISRHHHHHHQNEFIYECIIIILYYMFFSFSMSAALIMFILIFISTITSPSSCLWARGRVGLF